MLKKKKQPRATPGNRSHVKKYQGKSLSLPNPNYEYENTETGLNNGSSQAD